MVEYADHQLDRLAEVVRKRMEGEPNAGPAPDPRMSTARLLSEREIERITKRVFVMRERNRLCELHNVGGAGE